MKMPKRAVAIGMPAAMTEPKATRSTTTATIRPMPSLPSTGSAVRMIVREISACSPARRAVSTAASAALPSALPGGSTR